MLQQSRRLSSAPGIALRIIGSIVGLAFAAGGAALVAVSIAGQWVSGLFGNAPSCADPADFADFPPEALPADLDINYCGGWASEHIGPFQLILLVVGLGLVLFGLFVVLVSVRTAAWLAGTVLRVRGAVRTRTVDLATAEVTAGTATYTSGGDVGHHTVRTIKLIARDPASGRQLVLALRGASTDLLPPAELRALADAMTANRPESDVDVWKVAAQLRQLADNPLGLPLP